MKRVCPSATVQVVRMVLRVGERPIGLVAPFVNAHHKDHHRQLLVYTIVDIFQPAVEPTKMDTRQIDGSAAAAPAKFAFRETAAEVHMRPRTNDQALVPTCLFRAASLLHTHVILE